MFQFEDDEGRYGRMHDVFEGLETCQPGFDWRIFSLIREDREVALSALGLDAEDLWASRTHNVEALVSAPKVLRQLLSYRPDLVHVLTARPVESTLTRTVAERLDIPVVCGPNVGGWFPARPNHLWEDSTGDRLRNRLNYLANRASIRLTDPDRLLAFSDYHRTMVRSARAATPIEVLRPGVHPRFAPDASVPRETDLLYVGDLSDRKGYSIFVDALERLDGKRSLRVDIVGGTPDRKPRFETIDARYHGFVPRAELPRYYNRANLFVCLYADEMGPNTLIESLSCATPALVSEQSSLTEYLRGGNGVRCERSDIDDVVEAVRSCLEDPQRLIENARRVAPSYEICRTVEQLETIYRSETDTWP
ncbi:glycosyltransferase family 4 protein [Halosimplex halophilum]|uniref:glycosyltransferase family 4 protein n=1 Tax=Halosimplex halophilum TaxID=2559572 RepID=UPI0014355F43|nr:glycosyltransferase [Halosimplex halophilum]